MQHDSTQEYVEFEGLTPFAQVPVWILRSGKKLSSGAKALYATIMSYADNTSRMAFPGKDRLAEDMGVSVRSIFTFMKELEEFGALRVKRERNPRTGNFKSNNYVLVFAAPSAAYFPRPSEVDCPITRPNLTTPTSYTSDASASDPQKNCTSDKSDNLSRSKQASPATNPGGLTQGQRKTLRDQLVVIGKILESGKKFYDVEVQDQWDMFIGMVEDTFPAEFDSQLSDLLWNGKWTVSAKVATPYGAGAELNKLINTALSQ